MKWEFSKFSSRRPFGVMNLSYDIWHSFRFNATSAAASRTHEINKKENELIAFCIARTNDDDVGVKFASAGRKILQRRKQQKKNPSICSLCCWDFMFCKLARFEKISFFFVIHSDRFGWDMAARHEMLVKFPPLFDSLASIMHTEEFFLCFLFSADIAKFIIRRWHDRKLKMHKFFIVFFLSSRSTNSTNKQCSSNSVQLKNGNRKHIAQPKIYCSRSGVHWPAIKTLAKVINSRWECEKNEASSNFRFRFQSSEVDEERWRRCRGCNRIKLYENENYFFRLLFGSMNVIFNQFKFVMRFQPSFNMEWGWELKYRNSIVNHVEL